MKYLVSINAADICEKHQIPVSLFPLNARGCNRGKLLFRNRNEMLERTEREWSPVHIFARVEFCHSP